MRKTKKEKLTAALRRQKEFERIKLSLSHPQTESFPKQKLEVEKPQIYPQTASKQEGTITNLTNLSYLPGQLVRIGIITLVLILAQILIFLLIL